MPKKTKENLIPLNERTKEEQRKIQSNGGKASGEARRQRKSLKASMNALLDLPISSVKDFNKASRMGIPVEELDNSQLIVLALFNKAKQGDVYAIKELRNLIGEDDRPQELGLLEELVKGMQNEV